MPGTGWAVGAGVVCLETESAPKQPKYHNQRTVYGGRVYASKAEVAEAYRLDLEMRAGTIFRWEPQPQPVVLGPSGVLFKTDFLVYVTPDLKSFYYKEVKGVVTQRFRVIKQLWKIHGPAPLHVIYRKKTEVIYPGT